MLVGAQCYTVRAYTQNERDFSETMRRVAAMGYRSVQLSAYGPIAPQKLRNICDKYELSIVLTHYDPRRVVEDTDAVIAEHTILGCDYIGIGSMPDRYRNAWWMPRFFEDFTPAAQKIRDAGKLLMYHNHHFEWNRLPDGQLMIDALLSGMPADLMGVTLDTYWVQAAGADLYEWIEKLKGRIPCVHFKDMAIHGNEQRMAAVGDGNLRFDKIIEKLSAQGGTKHVLVEQDDCYGEDPFACLERSLRCLKGFGL